MSWGFFATVNGRNELRNISGVDAFRPIA